MAYQFERTRNVNEGWCYELSQAGVILSVIGPACELKYVEKMPAKGLPHQEV